MQPRKALPLAFEALAETKDVNARLLIAGQGEMRGAWERCAKSLHLGSRVEFLGQVPWDEMSSLYQSGDAFLFTSLRDSFGTQVLEAMGHGLPILTLDHQGVGTFVPSEAGIKVPVSSPRQTVADLAAGIRWVALYVEERLKMGQAALAFARTQTWEMRAQRMSNLYEEVRVRPAHQGAEGNFTCARETIQLGGPASCGSFQVLGVRVDAVEIPDVVAQMKEWIRKKTRCHSIAATGMHGIVEAQHDPEFKQILNTTDLVVPDGMPLVWLGRRKGHLLSGRVYGPDLLLAFCQESAEKGYRHFFYGAKPGVAERLAEKLKARFVGMNIVGTNSHPHRPLNQKEEDEIVAMISGAAPDVLWVGLGEPKQDRWMHAHKDKLRVPVLVGVGAAFDMLSGRRRQAPQWMREHGLEWFFRLCQEPRRLWRRYLIYGTEFLVYLALESLRLKKFGATGQIGGRRPAG